MVEPLLLFIGFFKQQTINEMAGIIAGANPHQKGWQKYKRKLRHRSQHQFGVTAFHKIKQKENADEKRNPDDCPDNPGEKKRAYFFAGTFRTSVFVVFGADIFL